MSLINPNAAVEKIKGLSPIVTITIYSFLGVAILLFHAHASVVAKSISVFNIFLFSVLLGPLIGNLSGWLSYRIFYGLSSNFFILDEGIAKRDVWKGIAYSNLGLIFAGILIVIQYLIYGDPLFSKMSMAKHVNVPMTYYYAIEVVKVILLTWAFVFSMWVLSKILNITIVQTLIVNFVSILLIYGLGRIVLYITVMTFLSL